jgi:16S rRNA (guanine966-N2)-methyltransferase
MRVIAGKLGGQVFSAPKGHHTHPMSDKIRGAIFNILGNIADLTVLDAFAGSGALSFEAVSSGASRVTAIDQDKNAYNAIVKNISDLKLGKQIKVIRANTTSWSEKNLTESYDIVFADPPYDNLQIGLLQKLVRHLKLNGIYVISWPGKMFFFIILVLVCKLSPRSSSSFSTNG